MTDPARVNVVRAVLADVATIGDVRAWAWATAIVDALDAHDRDAHVHDQRGNMTFEDETENGDD